MTALTVACWKVLFPSSEMRQKLENSTIFEVYLVQQHLTFIIGQPNLVSSFLRPFPIELIVGIFWKSPIPSSEKLLKFNIFDIYLVQHKNTFRSL